MREHFVDPTKDLSGWTAGVNNISAVDIDCVMVVGFRLNPNFMRRWPFADLIVSNKQSGLAEITGRRTRDRLRGARISIVSDLCRGSDYSVMNQAVIPIFLVCVFFG